MAIQRPQTTKNCERRAEREDTHGETSCKAAVSLEVRPGLRMDRQSPETDHTQATFQQTYRGSTTGHDVGYLYHLGHVKYSIFLMKKVHSSKFEKHKTMHILCSGKAPPAPCL